MTFNINCSLVWKERVTFHAKADQFFYFFSNSLAIISEAGVKKVK